MIILRILLLIILLVVCPAIIGGLLIGKRKSIVIGDVYFRGFTLVLAGFQLMALAVFFMGMPLHILSACYLIFMALLTVAALIWKHKTLLRGVQSVLKKGESRWPLWIAIALIVIQTFVCGVFMHMDQDDAFYVGTAVTSVSTDSIFKYDCYTGMEYTVLPSRYILSPFPIFLAVLAQISGIHVTIIAHTILPFLLIPISYYVYWMIGKCLFPKSKERAAVFLLLTAIVQMFSYYSVYTSGTFLLLRSWQGKAVLANILLPAIFCFGLTLWGRERKKIADWVFLGTLTTASCLVSTMGFMLAPITAGIMGILCAIKNKSFSIIVKTVCCCVPNMIFSVIYVMIR